MGTHRPETGVPRRGRVRAGSAPKREPQQQQTPLLRPMQLPASHVSRTGKKKTLPRTTADGRELVPVTGFLHQGTRARDGAGPLVGIQAWLRNKYRIPFRH
ncbi:hypothetical protein O3P69_017082 [Scylla paramamosain]|uniref:Uncharacterized protein n=1 Tax=Scylla paramamosain TaxID=85552 RepID=A0AAW0TX49_SCYPA